MAAVPVIDSHIHLYPEAEMPTLAWLKPDHPSQASIPWPTLEKYLEKVQEAAGEAWAKVKGFRYLLQDKPHGTMLTAKFVEGIKYLGKRGFAFEVGVDQHRRGKKQLDELVELISRAHEDVPEDEKTTFVINHMGKPDLTIYNLTDKGYINWREAVYTLSRCEKTYLQLSGGFPEMTDSLKNRSADEIFEAFHPWFGILLATFGPERLMFGTDWPVCTVGLEENALEKWYEVVSRMCYMASLSENKQRMLYAGAAIEAFDLDI
ncbi:unnamed protein product [Parascedosporium putredinis]|uniref:Amidohydrolase-related domain-containing protein n=1 Tax=Parascedosporium putredinis TaxID=1442378 RepID=A0A9P1MBW8_9PEZI|nr:unnamed protein product [Parascedosporium putredinis]CAI7995561.1 unnamed protein product [Parascedosporium putredinis]